MKRRDIQLSIVTMVRDELDVIPAFIGHHARLFDRIVVVDHRSVDGTREFLHHVAGKCGSCTIEVLRYDHAAYRQSMISTFLARREFRRGADWVGVLDADEFLDVRDREDLVRRLSGCGEVVAFSWLNLLPVNPPLDAHTIPPFETRQQFITLTSEWPPTRGKVLLHRNFARRHRRFVLPDGNHKVRAWNGGPKIPTEIVGRLLHVPARSPLQVLQKRENLVAARSHDTADWRDRHAHERQLEEARNVAESPRAAQVQSLFRAIVTHYEGTSGLGSRGASVALVDFPQVRVPTLPPLPDVATMPTTPRTTPVSSAGSARGDQMLRVAIRARSLVVGRHPAGPLLALKEKLRSNLPRWLSDRLSKAVAPLRRVLFRRDSG